MKKFFSILLLVGAFAAPSSATMYISTQCLLNASLPQVGYCVSGTYGTECNHYASSGTQCVGVRTVIDDIG